MSNLKNNRLDRTFTQQDLGLIKQLLDQLESVTSFRIALTPEERQSINRIGAANQPFVEDVQIMYQNGQDYFPPKP